MINDDTEMGLFEFEETCNDTAVGVYLTELFIFMNQYRWISNSYVAEFFTQNLWNKLPYSWQQCLEGLTLESVSNNVLLKNEKKNYNSVWPLSLLSFVVTCHALALNRSQRNFLQCDGGGTQELTGAFKKHIKPKKRHELAILPNVISTICKRTHSENVVDVGSGLGHLSRILAYRCELNVTAVEMAGQRLPVAEKFDMEILEELKQNMKAGNVREVNHIGKMISPDISTEEFLDIITNGKNSEKHNVDMHNERYVLVGLHTCGDLASTMLKVFTNTPVIKGIVSVSCCYFRMTLKKYEDDNTDFKFQSDYLYRILETRKCSCKSTYSTASPIENGSGSSDQMTTFAYGFPLSKFLKEIPFQPLKYKSFETACHFIDDYSQKLLGGSPNLKLHCYRAVMEVFIRYVDPSLALAPIRCKKIKHAASLTFIQYAGKVFERLGRTLDLQLLHEINYEELLSQWKNVVIFYSLTLLLGPVIESLVLVDKWMYLHENGFTASITPVFDASISPRNFVLVATRK